MSTRNEILNGALFEGWEDFCHEIANVILQHYRVADPCTNMTNRNPGEILSDPNNDKIHHVGGASGYPCDEIIQETRSQDAVPILTSVELGNNQIRTDTRARAYLGTDQNNLVDSTWTLVQLDSENYDSGGNFDTGNYKFTAPVNGFYLVVGQIMYHELIADKSYFAALRWAAAYNTINRIHASFNEWLGVRISDIIELTSGQTIELYARQESGGNLVDISSGSNYTFLAVHLLSQ